MDRLDALKVFCAVVDAGGFSRAAAKLGISTSSVTHQIGVLETHFGVKLLNRTTRSMSLTDEGRRCVEQARRLLEEMEELESSMNDAHQAPRGSLRVDMPGILARQFVAPALPGFLAAYPELSVRLTANDRLIDMVDEGVDVMLRIGELPDSGLVARSVFKNRYICCASPEFIARHGRPQHPDDLNDIPCLNFVYPKARQLRPWTFQQDGQPFTSTPRGAVAMDHVESLIEMAVSGGGVVQHLSVSLIEPLRSGALVPLLAQWQAPGPDVSVLYPQRHQRAARIKVFVDFVDALFKNAAASCPPAG
ncbi:MULTISPECIES: LysR family transcriptional regulator [unclassified Duganella]|uniref:LysR family transcriptional regulator n=1 Tax=unclassified Duganella TaxID=2636909 RepID=UPI000E342103|nr:MULTISPECIES: LysR family transcriptional regulator [unclassified Duganella]RFP16230.1 LysR family transcriptional regulator [Duganella sp. BJB475]RFP32608.1 LysR family transcriptional regulator [Duganella sp. BJB476]